MQITVNTKYEIGQQVYLCKTKLKFKDGDFVNASVPNLNPFTVTSIRIHQHLSSQSIYYRLDGLQKSIRGSDPNGAMYYFAKLIEYNDIESLERRVLVCAYEDVGLANPNACMRTVAAFQAARTVGFPEARIPIASAIIDFMSFT